MRRATVVARRTTSNSDLRRVLQAQNLTTIPLITCLLFKGKCKQNHMLCSLFLCVCVCLSLSMFFFCLVGASRSLSLPFLQWEKEREWGRLSQRLFYLQRFSHVVPEEVVTEIPGFFNSRIPGTFSISLQCKSPGFYHSRISKAHTYILSIKFAQFFYFLWISVVTMEESGVPLLDCICIGGTAVFQSCPVFFYFCVAV